MAINPLNDISSIYMKEVFEPQLGKKGSSPAPAGGAKKVEKGKEDAESSAKRIRQAVYDIRYRARREDVKLDQAFNQYMSHTTMTGPEKTAVKEKLGLVSGPVSEETEQKKYKVRVTDKSSGKSYVRYATREKINSLRSNPNIRSVEMTAYGQPYEGERTKGDRTAAAKAGKDYDGDGKVESGAKEYRGVIHNKIQQKRGGKPDGKDTSSVKEQFSNWRNDLCEVMDKIETKSNPKMITGKGAKNVIKTSALGGGIKLPEAIQNLGGELIEMVEIDEAQMTSAEKKEEKKLKTKYDPSGMKASMIKQYGSEKGKNVYFATIRKKAMQNAGYELEGETIQELAPATQTAKPESTQQTKPQNTSAVSAVLQAKQKADAAEKDLAAKQKMAAQKGVNLASISSSYEMEGELVDEKLATQYGKPNRLSQSSQRKSLGRGSSIKDGSKPTGYESKKEFRDTEMKYQKNSFEPEGEEIAERTAFAKRTGMSATRKGKPSVEGGAKDDPAFTSVKRTIRKMEGTPKGQQKKVPGKKPPAAGQSGSERRSPAQQVAMRRAAAQRSQDNMSSRFD